MTCPNDETTIASILRTQSKEFRSKSTLCKKSHRSDPHVALQAVLKQVSSHGLTK